MVQINKHWMQIACGNFNTCCTFSPRGSSWELGFSQQCYHLCTDNINLNADSTPLLLSAALKQGKSFCNTERPSWTASVELNAHWLFPLVPFPMSVSNRKDIIWHYIIRKSPFAFGTFGKIKKKNGKDPKLLINSWQVSREYFLGLHSETRYKNRWCHQPLPKKPCCLRCSSETHLACPTEGTWADSSQHSGPYPASYATGGKPSVFVVGCVLALTQILHYKNGSQGIPLPRWMS